MNIESLELNMKEIYEIVFRNHKDESRSYSLNHFGKNLNERVLEIKPSGYDFFGNCVWNCEDLISCDIASREEIELYVREKNKFINAAFYSNGAYLGISAYYHGDFHGIRTYQPEYKITGGEAPNDT